ncbi:MAG: 3-phenylpropionate/cinnamic acid dioxygenase small subunit [Halieaceae bacterium]|jgi:3-phenylpropionate/cinnamic acid dioxygenase small subunit
MSSSAREIENLLYLYAERLDLGDLEGMANMFAEAEFVGPEGEVHGRGSDAIKEIYTSYVRMYADGTPMTHHVTSNVIIEVNDDSATATSRSYFTVFQATDDLGLRPIMAGRYHDEFVCVDGHWQFSRRQMIPWLEGDISHHKMR